MVEAESAASGSRNVALMETPQPSPWKKGEHMQRHLNFIWRRLHSNILLHIGHIPDIL